MSEDKGYNWDESKVIDRVDFDEEEASLFHSLLKNQHEKENEEKGGTVVPGMILKGCVVEITPDFVVVDVGLKSEGLISIDEFREDEPLELGGDVEVYLDSAEGEDGQIILSKEKADRQKQWEYIVNHCKEGAVVRGKVVRKVKGGLMVDIGLEAFLPGSQIDNKRVKNTDEFLYQEYDFKVLKINIERKNIVLSRRELLEEEKNSKKARVLESLKVGEMRKGIVKNITDFGVFIDLDGVDGLLHITDMTWKRIRHPSEMVQPLEELEVIVLNIDLERERVALGLKQKEPNPWAEIEKKYPPGSRVRGKIVNLVPYGAFVEVEPGMEGLIHVSEMSWVKSVMDPAEVVAKGDEVEAVVLSIQKDEGKFSLGIKQTQPNPWEHVEQKYPVGTQVRVEVRNLANYGAFVALEPGIDGLIHISDLSWTKRASHPSEILKKGEMIDAIVLSVDRESRKVTLGIKQLTDDPWKSIEQSYPVGSVVVGVVTKVTAFGAFVRLENGIEGLIHVNELSDQTFGETKEVISVGHQVTASVSKLDLEHRKVFLSVKNYLSGGASKKRG